MPPPPEAPAITPAFMVQGVGSNVGKSLLVAGLCRLFARRGLAVRPFKPQNMSNNAAVTLEGGEIGRAQALQARACHTPPSIHMNPVLLKPESDTGAQLIIQGVREGTLNARDYGRHKAALMPKVLDSFSRLKAEADLVIIEGAGSPAEVNLRRGDIANMGFAEAADVPVVLVGDIDKGGVIASLIGTAAVLEAAETARIKGFIINKFRGDAALFADAMGVIEKATGWPGLGIVPWFDAARRLPAEDILDLESRGRGGGSADKRTDGGGHSSKSVTPPPTGYADKRTGGGDYTVRDGSLDKRTGRHADGDTSTDFDKSTYKATSRLFHIAVPILRRIANFDDLDPLAADLDIRLTLTHPGEPLPMDADLILLPGSKATISDLAFLREQGWDIDLIALRRQGRVIMGLCGGYQMLGRAVHDPAGLEGASGSAEGLGLLDIETTLGAEKTTRFVEGMAYCGGVGSGGGVGSDGGGMGSPEGMRPVKGYEIHLGVTSGGDTMRPMVIRSDGRPDGAISRDGRVMGCYMHGLFASDAYRGGWLAHMGAETRSGGLAGGGRAALESRLCFEDSIEETLEALADHLAEHMDIAALTRIAGLG